MRNRSIAGNIVDTLPAQACLSTLHIAAISRDNPDDDFPDSTASVRPKAVAIPEGALRHRAEHPGGASATVHTIEPAIVNKRVAITQSRPVPDRRRRAVGCPVASEDRAHAPPFVLHPNTVRLIRRRATFALAIGRATTSRRACIAAGTSASAGTRSASCSRSSTGADLTRTTTAATDRTASADHTAGTECAAGAECAAGTERATAAGRTTSVGSTGHASSASSAGYAAAASTGGVVPTIRIRRAHRLTDGVATARDAIVPTFAGRTANKPKRCVKRRQDEQGDRCRLHDKHLRN